jgi:hypothetical protein
MVQASHNLICSINFSDSEIVGAIIGVVGTFAVAFLSLVSYFIAKHIQYKETLPNYKISKGMILENGSYKIKIVNKSKYPLTIESCQLSIAEVTEKEGKMYKIERFKILKDKKDISILDEKHYIFTRMFQYTKIPFYKKLLWLFTLKKQKIESDYANIITIKQDVIKINLAEELNQGHVAIIFFRAHISGTDKFIMTPKCQKYKNGSIKQGVFGIGKSIKIIKPPRSGN